VQPTDASAYVPICALAIGLRVSFWRDVLYCDRELMSAVLARGGRVPSFDSRSMASGPVITDSAILGPMPGFPIQAARVTAADGCGDGARTKEVVTCRLG